MYSVQEVAEVLKKALPNTDLEIDQWESASFTVRIGEQVFTVTIHEEDASG